ncbi:MAG: low molecular weight protein-tyrosine-phosphatase [Bdellovibrionota bacterium]
MIKVLFVCTGNICRSPTAEGIFRKYVDDEGLSEKIYIESAGLLDYHEGDNADHRTQLHAKKRGFDLSQILSRPIVRDDFKNFDYLIAMDGSHLQAMIELCPESHKPGKVIKLMLDYSNQWKGKGVPDPYHTGEDGFELVLDMLEESCRELLIHIKANHKL